MPDAAATPGAESADFWDERPSKSQRKRDSHALQTLGEALVALPASRLSRVPMPDALRDAVTEYLRTRSHEGRRRQMQYIGRLMRGADVAPIRAAVDDHAHGRAQDALALHTAERWRAELIAEDAALDRWIAEHPDTDMQHVRTLVRNARREGAAEASTPAGAVPRKGRAYRELFQFVRDGLS